MAIYLLIDRMNFCTEKIDYKVITRRTKSFQPFQVRLLDKCLSTANKWGMYYRLNTSSRFFYRITKRRTEYRQELLTSVQHHNSYDIESRWTLKSAFGWNFVLLLAVFIHGHWDPRTPDRLCFGAQNRKEDIYSISVRKYLINFISRLLLLMPTSSSDKN